MKSAVVPLLRFFLNSHGPKRSELVSAQEEFEQIRLQFVDPIQHDYEVIRPIVLFGDTAAERSRQTGVERTVVGDKARRFVLGGMESLRDGRTEPAERHGSTYPEAIAGYIVYLKQLYLPIHLREIERILLRKFGYKTNHHTLKRFLAPYDTPIQLEFDLTTFSSYASSCSSEFSRRRAARSCSPGAVLQSPDLGSPSRCAPALRRDA
jgi:hypothetical protein